MRVVRIFTVAQTIVRHRPWLLTKSFAAANINIVRAMATQASERYVGTTRKGLTREFSVPVPWGQISGKTWGDEGNPPIICMHGWLDNCNTFDKLIPLLPQDYYYVAFDTPGHGLSSHFPAGMFYFTMAYCGVIKRLIDYFKFDKVTFLGHSMGANVAAHFSGLYPEICNRLIVIDTLGIWYRIRGDFTSALRSCIDSQVNYEKEDKPAKKYTYDEAKERLKDANKDLDDEGIEILLERGMKEVENEKYEFTRDIRHLFKDPLERNLDSALAVIKNIDAHVLIILAEGGMWQQRMKDAYPKDYKRIMDTYENCFKSFKLSLLDGNHHLHLCNPEESATVITEFLEAHPTAEETVDRPDSKI